MNCQTRAPVEDIELTEQEEAESAAYAKRFVGHLMLGDGAPAQRTRALRSINETLMPGGALLANEGR